LLPSSHSSPASIVPLPHRFGGGGPPSQPSQPFNARHTAWMSPAISTVPLPLASNTSQVDSAAEPSAMLPPEISSLIATVPSSLQSPTQAPCAHAPGVASSNAPATITNSFFMKTPFPSACLG